MLLPGAAGVFPAGAEEPPPGDWLPEPPQSEPLHSDAGDEPEPEPVGA